MELQIKIPSLIYSKIMHWVDKAGTYEVSGMGKIIKRNDCYEVIDCWLCEQENTGSTTDMTAESIAKLLYTSRTVEGHLNWWWHSHASMGVFWSGTDTATINELSANGWVVATVFNNKREMKSAMRFKGDDIRPDVLIDNVKTTIVYPEIDKSVVDSWDTEYTTNVKSKTYQGYSGGHGAWDYERGYQSNSPWFSGGVYDTKYDKKKFKKDKRKEEAKKQAETPVAHMIDNPLGLLNEKMKVGSTIPAFDLWDTAVDFIHRYNRRATSWKELEGFYDSYLADAFLKEASNERVAD